MKKLKTIFSGSRSGLFSIKIEQRIKAKLYEKYPELNTKHNDVVLSFLTQGMFHTVAGCREEDIGKLYDEIVQLLPRSREKFSASAFCRNNFTYKPERLNLQIVGVTGTNMSRRCSGSLLRGITKG